MDFNSPDQNYYSQAGSSEDTSPVTTSSKTKYNKMFLKNRSPIIFVLIFAVIGTIVLFRSLAATPSITKVWATNADWNGGTLSSVAVANNSVGLASSASIPASSNTNLALSKPVVASSVESSSLPA